jgi:ABC-type branched-subunit amino acid transport system substrate-binding protein
MRLLLAGLAAAGTVLASTFVSGAGAGAAATPLRVALLQPSGGFFAQQNALIASGAQIAADESGAANSPVGSVKISLVPTPLATDAAPKQVVASLHEKGINVAVLPCDVDSTAALARAGSDAGMLMLLPCDPDPKLPASTPMVWPTGMAGNEQVAQIVNYAQSLNGTTAFILSANGPAYISTMNGYFRAAAKLDGVKIVGEGTVGLNGKNLAEVAAAIKKAKPRVIYTALFAPYGQSIVAGLRSHGIVIPPFYATDGLDGDLQLGRYGAKLDNLNVASYGFPRPTSAEFFRDYASAYGHIPSGSFPGLGYETIHILDTAAGLAGSADAKAIDAAFSKGFKVTGVALEDVQYLGKGNRVPRTNSGLARIVRGSHVALFSSDATETARVPAP